MRNPFRRRTPVEMYLDAEIKWMSEALNGIGHTNPDAAWRLAQNIKDRVRLQPRDEHPLDTPIDCAKIILAALDVEQRRIDGLA